MSTWGDAFSSGKATLYLDVVESSTDSGANTSVVSFTLRLVGNNASYLYDTAATYSVTIDGTTYTGSYAYDFRSNNTPTLRTGSKTVTHNADGSKSITVYASSSYTDLGSASITSKTFTLTDFDVPPDAPTAPTLSRAIDGTSIAVTSDHPSSPVTITNYRYQYSTNGSTWNGPVTMGSDGVATFGPTSPITCVPTTTYYFRTAAYSSEGWGSYGTSRSIAGIPTQPASITAVRTGRNVLVTSGTSTGATAYYAQYSSDNGTTWSTKQVLDASRQYNYTNLTPGLTYLFRVYATNTITTTSGHSDYRVSAGVFVPAGGRRWDGSAWTPTSIAKRWTGSAWVDIVTAKRWNGSAWVDLS